MGEIVSQIGRVKKWNSRVFSVLGICGVALLLFFQWNKVESKE